MKIAARKPGHCDHRPGLSNYQAGLKRTGDGFKEMCQKGGFPMHRILHRLNLLFIFFILFNRYAIERKRKIEVPDSYDR